MENTGNLPSLDNDSFDWRRFIKQTVLRTLCWVFAIVVFGTISDQGYYSPTSKTNGTCMFNNNECACSYAVGVGVLAFVACVVFPILDVIISKISSATAKERIVKGDLAFSAAMTFLWFICFCVLLNQWTRTNSEYVMADAARAAVAFSFFSIITWAVLAYVAYGRYNVNLNTCEWLTALFPRIIGNGNSE
ncbi:synaptogyrin-2-like [Astatotilapia calliptera]|uniref:MARVEL domain-containing protein n=1 Tax=Astatotilapia calliptera TaxID=8154 RepID=A0A3P8R8Q1_ASTCA|nr:synaptogyrin-2-like [Astatotilapia calliptera]